MCWNSCSEKKQENQVATIDFAMLQVVRLKFQQYWAVAQGDLFDKFKEDNIAKVSLSKLLPQEKLLVSFHQLATLMISRKNALAKRLCDSNQIRSNKRVGSANTLKHFHNQKIIKMTYQNGQISKTTTKITRQYVATVSQRRLSHLVTS